MVDDSIQIRNATPEDVAELQVFLHPFAEKELILPRTDDDLRVLTRHGFVAQHENQLVGFAAIEIYSRKLAEVQALAVEPAYQGQGIGRELVSRCVGRSRAEGVLELMAITASDDLFRASGFDYSLPNQKRALFLQTKLDQK